MASQPTSANLFARLEQVRNEFLALVADIRPDLLRYCARMMGSIAEGEDVVQDTLARACYELPQLEELPALRPWLFRIAHNRALDCLRRYERRMSEPIEVALDVAEEDQGPDGILAREQAVRAAVSRFLELAPAQRSCVILKDVLDYSLDEIASLLEFSVPAVKAALHRGRTRLRELATAASEPAAPHFVSPAVARYAELFNARDWDGVRAMLVDDVRLDLVSREKRAGRDNVSHYFTNYGRVRDWHLVPGWLDGREVLAVFRGPADPRPGYFIELTLHDDRVATIRDFRYVPYIAREAEILLMKGTAS
jgi:RNA polymerase sigma-70 factor (ECF subfamily)